MILNRKEIINKFNYIKLDQIFQFCNNRSYVSPYYLNNPKVEKEILKCYMKLFSQFLKGHLNDWRKLLKILKLKPSFSYMLPSTILILFKQKYGYDK